MKSFTRALGPITAICLLFPITLFLAGVRNPAALATSYLFAPVLASAYYVWWRWKLRAAKGSMLYEGRWEPALLEVLNPNSPAQGRRVKIEGVSYGIGRQISEEELYQLYTKTSRTEFPRGYLPLFKVEPTSYLCYIGSGSDAGSLVILEPKEGAAPELKKVAASIQELWFKLGMPELAV